MVLLIGVLCLMPPQRTPQPNELNADTIKAGFLFNFAQFATWPGDDGSVRKVRLCVQRGVLDETVFAGWGDSAGPNRKLGLTMVDRPGQTFPPIGCDLIFVGPPNAAETEPGLIAMARRDHILLVSDGPGFASSGGHIELFLDKSQYRFRVNLSELKRSGVELSSKVLRLAEIVEETPRGTSP